MAHSVSLLTHPNDPALSLIDSSTRYGGKLLPSRLASTPPPSVPGITIIRPLCGLDNNLYNALESSMKLEYPKYEVLFAVQDDRDEAIPIVTMVMERFPHVRSKLIVGKIVTRCVHTLIYDRR